MALTEPGIMSNAENTAGASCKGGIYSRVQLYMPPVTRLHTIGDGSGYYSTGIVRLQLRVIQIYRKAERRHVADEPVSKPPIRPAEVDQPCEEVYGSGMKASTSSGSEKLSNGLVVGIFSTLTNGSSRRRLRAGSEKASESEAKSSTLTNAMPLLM